MDRVTNTGFSREMMREKALEVEGRARTETPREQ